MSLVQGISGVKLIVYPCCELNMNTKSRCQSERKTDFFLVNVTPAYYQSCVGSS